jgi:tetratricopeptide (TPR) repeat protein
LNAEKSNKHSEELPVCASRITTSHFCHAFHVGVLTAFCTLIVIATNPSLADETKALPVPTAQEIVDLQKQVDDSPQDAKAHLAYAHALRLAGKHELAAKEYLEATSLEPSLFVAYHELSLSKAGPELLDEAIERLNHLRENQPKNLMLRVALSELLEQRGKLYPAAKVLVDLVYDNAVPEQYLPKVKARIHYLLAKNKDAMAVEKAVNDDLENDSTPLPLPESSLRRNAATKTMKDAKVMQNFGNSTLLP